MCEDLYSVRLTVLKCYIIKLRVSAISVDHRRMLCYPNKSHSLQAIYWLSRLSAVRPDKDHPIARLYAQVPQTDRIAGHKPHVTASQPHLRLIGHGHV